MIGPVFLCRKAFILSFLLLVSGAFVQAQTSSRKSAERLLKIPNLDAVEAARFIRDFRNVRLDSDFVFDFQIKHIPARGRPDIYGGLLAGSWNATGPVQRMDLVDSKNADDSLPSWLLRSGATAEIYRKETKPLSDALMWSPLTSEKMATDFLIKDVPVTAFDLQLPFIYWDTFTWLKGERVLGRPAHIFEMKPPAPVELPSGTIGTVRLFVDIDFKALLRAEYFDTSGNLIRQIKVLSFKEVSGQWIPKAIDFIDEGSREKVRFEVKGAALGLKLSEELFDEKLEPQERMDVSGFKFERL